MAKSRKSSRKSKKETWKKEQKYENQNISAEDPSYPSQKLQKMQENFQVKFDEKCPLNAQKNKWKRSIYILKFQNTRNKVKN